MIGIDRLEITESPMISNFGKRYLEKYYVSDKLIYQISDGIFLKEIAAFEKYYLNAFDVYINQRRFGVLLTDGKRNFGNTVEVRIDKESLYEDSNPWFPALMALNNHLSFQFGNIKYLEVYLDSETPFRKKYLAYYFQSIHHVNGEKLYKKCNSTGTNILYDEKEVVIGKKSYRQIAIYTKQSPESYIQNRHIRNGFFQRVDRVEARIKAKFIRDLERRKLIGISLESLCDENCLKEIFRISVGDALSFKDLNNYEYVNRNKKYKQHDVIDFLQILGPTQNIELPLPRKAIVKRSIIKRHFHKLYDSYVFLGNENALEAVKEYISFHCFKYNFKEMAESRFKNSNAEVNDHMIERVQNLYHYMENLYQYCTKETNKSLSYEKKSCIAVNQICCCDQFSQSIMKIRYCHANAISSETHV